MVLLLFLKDIFTTLHGYLPHSRQQDSFHLHSSSSFFILYLFRTMICQVDTYWHLLSFSSFSNLLVKVKLWAKHRWVKWSIDCIDCWLDITVQQYPGNDDKWSRTRTTTSYHLLVSSPLLSMFDHKNKSVMKQLLTFFFLFFLSNLLLIQGSSWDLRNTEVMSKRSLIALGRWT